MQNDSARAVKQDPAVMLEAINASSGRSGPRRTSGPTTLTGTLDSGFPDSR